VKPRSCRVKPRSCRETWRLPDQPIRLTPDSATFVFYVITIVSHLATFVSYVATFVSYVATFVSCVATFVSHSAALPLRGAIFVCRFAHFASQVGSYGYLCGTCLRALAAFVCRVGAFASKVGTFAFEVGTFAFEVGTFASRCGAFAFLGGHAAQALNRVTLAQLLDAIIPDRTIDVGRNVDNVGHRFAERAKRGLEMVVVGGRADATACRDHGPFAFHEKGFVNDLTLRWREVGQMSAKDAIELIEVVFLAPLNGRRRVVLIIVVPREDPVELTVGDIAAANRRLRRLGLMGMDRALGDAAVADAVDGVVPDDGEELTPEVVLGRRDRGRFLRVLQRVKKAQGGAVDDFVDALAPDELGRHAARGGEVGDDAIPECRELGLGERRRGRVSFTSSCNFGGVAHAVHLACEKVGTLYTKPRTIGTPGEEKSLVRREFASPGCRLLVRRRRREH